MKLLSCPATKSDPGGTKQQWTEEDWTRGSEKALLNEEGMMRRKHSLPCTEALLLWSIFNFEFLREENPICLTVFKKMF